MACSNMYVQRTTTTNPKAQRLKGPACFTFVSLRKQANTRLHAPNYVATHSGCPATKAPSTQSARRPRPCSACSGNCLAPSPRSCGVGRPSPGTHPSKPFNQSVSARRGRPSARRMRGRRKSLPHYGKLGREPHAKCARATRAESSIAARRMSKIVLAIRMTVPSTSPRAHSLICQLGAPQSSTGRTPERN